MSGDGYKVDADALKRVEKGINDAMAELKEFGFDIEANLGRGFDDMALSGLEVGHAALVSTFTEFCDRWGWGVRSLMQDANEFAHGLGLSAGIYHDQEEYVEGVLKVGVSSAMGSLAPPDPNKPQDAPENKSWGEIWHDNPMEQMKHADFSADSAQEAQDQALNAGASMVDDLSTSPLKPMGMPGETEWDWDGQPESAGEGKGEGQ